MASVRFAIMVLMLVGPSVTAETNIHRCSLDDGTIAFQEMPCSEPASPPTPIEPTLPVSASRDRAECEKTTRDAIDAIDLTMRKNAYSKEQGQEYLAELLELTRQLRACKQL